MAVTYRKLPNGALETINTDEASKAELTKMARDLEIEGRSKMDKEELAEAIFEASATPGSPNQTATSEGDGSVEAGQPTPQKSRRQAGSAPDEAQPRRKRPASQSD